jgi:hypothetical protein
MTTPEPPDSTESARSGPGLALARANRPGANDRQQPSRRQQMLYAAAYAAQKLDEAAEQVPDPAELRLAADGLRAAALRLAAPKPRRKPSQQLPRPGHATRVARDVTLEELLHATAAAQAIANTAHLTQP